VVLVVPVVLLNVVVLDSDSVVVVMDAVEDCEVDVWEVEE
jgi:hypothetical protein